MNPYQATLVSVLEVLQEQKMDHLLVGGHVVTHYGYTRMTTDIDLMMVIPDVGAIVKAMRNAGFTSYSISPLVIFFQKSEPSIRVDFLRIDMGTFTKLMRSAVTANILGCQVIIPSLTDLLAMKFFSYSQSPMRRFKDLDDIVCLSNANKLNPEAILRPLALRFADEEAYQRVYAMLPPNPDRNAP